MTLPVVETKLIEARRDLPRYPLPEQCAMPDCGFRGTEVHHVFRRRTPAFRDAWWVEADGHILPAKVRLCNEHHAELTDHRARLLWTEEDDCFLWLERDGEVWEALGELDPPLPRWEA